MTRKKKLWFGIAVPLLVLAILFTACAVYLGNYYHADEAAIAAFLDSGKVRAEELPGQGVAFVPKSPDTGLIFYPGGKVEHTAYYPLMQALAERGILCVLLEMPFRLAVLDQNAADGVQAQYPQISHWYIGGHSLGGSMAASYLGKHAEDYEGLLLLGAYSTEDLRASDLSVLSMYGSEDLVMNQEKYSACKENLPKNLREYVIEGGCHAYFGMYGAQKGDGSPTLTNVQQIEIAAEQFADFVKHN